MYFRLGCGQQTTNGIERFVSSGGNIMQLLLLANGNRYISHLKCNCNLCRRDDWLCPILKIIIIICKAQLFGLRSEVKSADVLKSREYYWNRGSGG